MRKNLCRGPRLSHEHFRAYQSNLQPKTLHQTCQQLVAYQMIKHPTQRVFGVVSRS